MNELTTFRLYLLRATYLLIVIGLGVMIWPGILNPPRDLAHSPTVVRSLLGGVSLIALLGLRYPVKMIPLLLFELAWKSVWIIAFGLPRLFSGTLSGAHQETWNDCMISVVIFVLVIPWPHVFNTFVQARGDSWRGRGRGTPATPAAAV